MKFSLVTIVLNDKENIKKTLRSVISQKNNDTEYIIIDGGSTDGTLEILEHYRKDIDILVSEKDNGIVDAFNKGIQLAKGEIIGIVNSGDWLEKDTLRKIKEVFEDAENPDIVYGDVQYWKNGEQEYTYTANHQLLNRFMSLNHPAVFVKKQIYDQFGLFDTDYPTAMDYELMLRFYKSGATFKYIGCTLSNMSLGGVSDIHWQKAYREAYEIRKRHLGFTLKLYVSYIWQLLKRHISNTLSSVGLDKVRTIYRKYFSVIKKKK